MSLSKSMPPMIDGVSPSRLYLEKLSHQPDSLFVFLCEKFPHITPDEWRGRFGFGQVLDEDLTRLDVNARYVAGRTIYYYRILADEIVVPFEHYVLFENDEFMVVDKPHFLAVTPTGDYVKQTLLTRLKMDTNNPNLSPIHRLDRETAGLILISKNPATRHLYQALFAHHAICKVYHAICIAYNPPASLDVSLHLERGEPFYIMRVCSHKPANTHTHIRLMDKHEGLAKYELYPTTGKLHQLRVHLAHLDMPIRHDPYYPAICHKPKGDFGSPLQLLAKRLSFTDPITAHRWEFESGRELVF